MTLKIKIALGRIFDIYVEVKNVIIKTISNAIIIENNSLIQIKKNFEFFFCNSQGAQWKPIHTKLKTLMNLFLGSWGYRHRIAISAFWGLFKNISISSKNTFFRVPVRDTLTDLKKVYQLERGVQVRALALKER